MPATLETEFLPKPRTYDTTCHGNAYFAYFIPSALHLIAYLYTVYLFRVKENEQLQNLMERAFLLSSNPANCGGQRRLVRILWFFIGLGVIWIILALTTVSFMIAIEPVTFQWLKRRYEDGLYLFININLINFQIFKYNNCLLLVLQI